MAHLERWLWRGGVYGIGALFLLLLAAARFTRDYGWYMLLILPLIGLALLVAAAAVLVPLLKRRPIWRRVALASLGLVVLMWLPWARIDCRIQFQAFQARYEEVVEKVRSGEWEPDQYGRLILPRSYRYLSEDGQAYVWRKDSDLEVRFQVASGWLFERWEYVYSNSKPPRRMDWVMEVEWQRGPWYYLYLTD